jgi:hypothetical protein
MGVFSSFFRSILACFSMRLWSAIGRPFHKATQRPKRSFRPCLSLLEIVERLPDLLKSADQ